jgi:hypothetical protein
LAKLAYDLLRALELLADSWPDIIVTRKGRRLRKSSVRAVLMALHRRCHWKTLVVAVPDRFGRVHPATATDIAAEVARHPRTVEYVMWWLMEQRILVRLRGHGWTGATVRRFDLKRIAQLLASSEPEMSTMLISHSERLPVATEPEMSRLLNFSAHNQEEEARDTDTPGVESHQGTTLISGAAEVAPPTDSEEANEIPREAVEQVIGLLPAHRREKDLRKLPEDWRWSVEDDVVVVDFRNETHYQREREVLAELADAVRKVIGLEVELRLRGQRQEHRR